MKHPLVSIITVNYKQPKVTCELLDSIQRLSYPNLEVIVVDNEQSSNDLDLYKAHFNNVKVLRSEKNLGFAGGNNLALKEAKGEFVYLVNNDTELDDANIQNLVMALGEKKIGAISPVLRYYDNPDLVQFAGFTKINSFTGRNHTIQKLSSDSGLINTAYIHGAAVMLRREVIEKVGLMPEEYFLYYEEFAWSENIKNAGYVLKVSMDTSVLHKESITTGKNSPLKTYYQTRNRLAFMTKHSKVHELVAFKFFFSLISIPIGTISYYLKRERSNMKAFYKAINDGLIHKVSGQRFNP